MSAADMKDWREEFEKNAKAVCETFKTTDGKKVIKLLKTRFGAGTVYDDNPYKMAKNAGQHEIVQYLEAMLERGIK
jgi:hypothetical protein